MNTIFFHLLRFAIGQEKDFGYTLTAWQWQEVYAMAVKQTLVGVLFRGVERLAGEQCPPRQLLMQWLVASGQLERANAGLNSHCVEVSRRMAKAGFGNCILKGQGNALMYPDPMMRTPGDIDLWLDGTPHDVMRFVRRHCGNMEYCYHHIEMPPYKGTPVEAHYRPAFLQNPVHNSRLQRYFEDRMQVQMDNKVLLPGQEEKVAVPTAEFNRIFQLAHMANHFGHEGIGLRQMLDYYYVLRQGFTPEEQAHHQALLRATGMYGFCGAVIWVLVHCFGLPEQYRLVPPNERFGRQLLLEILEGGNFGQHDTRVAGCYRRKGIYSNLLRLGRDFRLLRYYPSECIAEPFFRLLHYGWRVKNRMKADN